MIVDEIRNSPYLLYNVLHNSSLPLVLKHEVNARCFTWGPENLHNILLFYLTYRINHLAVDVLDIFDDIGYFNGLEEYCIAVVIYYRTDD